MLKHVNGNLITGNFSIIVHQVNCKGVMGAGLAKQIRNIYPGVYDDYIRALRYENAGLGHVIFSYAMCDPEKYDKSCRTIVSMLAQDGYGRDKRYTDYDAFKECLEVFRRYLESYDSTWTVAFPYGIGCGLAGGDWNIIEKMIKEFSEQVKQNVYIVRLR